MQGALDWLPSSQVCVRTSGSRVAQAHGKPRGVTHFCTMLSSDLVFTPWQCCRQARCFDCMHTRKKRGWSHGRSHSEHDKQMQQSSASNRLCEPDVMPQLNQHLLTQETTTRTFMGSVPFSLHFHTRTRTHTRKLTHA